MREIDIENWDRKTNYDWFSQFPNPCFGMDVRMDITELLRYCRAKGISSFAAILYIVKTCAEEIESFRYRMVDGKVVVVDELIAGYTQAVGELFLNAYVAANDFTTFSAKIDQNKEDAASSMKKFKEYNAGDRPECIYTTCMPWLDFVSAVHPIPTDPFSNSVPRIAWGKYVEEGDRVKMTLNITASHALVDGRDMAKLFNLIQDRMNAPDLL